MVMRSSYVFLLGVSTANICFADDILARTNVGEVQLTLGPEFVWSDCRAIGRRASINAVPVFERGILIAQNILDPLSDGEVLIRRAGDPVNSLNQDYTEVRPTSVPIASTEQSELTEVEVVADDAVRFDVSAEFNACVYDEFVQIQSWSIFVALEIDGYTADTEWSFPIEGDTVNVSRAIYIPNVQRHSDSLSYSNRFTGLGSFLPGLQYSRDNDDIAGILLFDAVLEVPFPSTRLTDQRELTIVMEYALPVKVVID